MSNSYFRFKKFIVNQDKCAMKVCTDACILGAWVAGKFEGRELNKVLDIGAGTGLLSLMLAQKINASIDAVEINKEAADQAAENVDGSPWRNSINVLHQSIHDFTAQENYDLIICNPPFYEADLKSPDAGKNAAMHDTTLTLKELLQFVEKHLSKGGSFAILLPYHRVLYFEGSAHEQGLFVQEKLLVRQTNKHDFFRGLMLFSREMPQIVVTNELAIHNEERQYTTGFEELLKDYYLKF